MAEASQVVPSAALRDELDRLGAESVSRCYQCSTCSSVCDLSEADNPFPRRQMLLAQWGLEDRLVIDSAVWLCHQCTDCSERCPRDAKPGDVMQTLREVVIERLAYPQAMGKLVGRSAVTWPLLLLGPWIFWLLLIWLLPPEGMPAGDDVVYARYVPHWLVYAVFMPASAWVMLSAWVSGSRFWKSLDGGDHGGGSFLSGVTGVVTDIALHRSFSPCGTIALRRWGHLALFWGFMGAFATTISLIYVSHIQHKALPLHFWHPLKVLGNVSAVLLVLGGVLLVVSRFKTNRAMIATRAFDMFFLAVVVLVIVTGVGAELVRFFVSPTAAYGLYTVHLGVVLTMFLTFPYSKFAHMLYRALALIHQRMKASSAGEST